MSPIYKSILVKLEINLNFQSIHIPYFYRKFDNNKFVTIAPFLEISKFQNRSRTKEKKKRKLTK